MIEQVKLGTPTPLKNFKLKWMQIRDLQNLSQNQPLWLRAITFLKPAMRYLVTILSKVSPYSMTGININIKIIIYFSSAMRDSIKSIFILAGCVLGMATESR